MRSRNLNYVFLLIQKVDKMLLRNQRNSGVACQLLGFTSSWQMMQQIIQTVLIEVTVELY
jgi:hypothetical protein